MRTGKESEVVLPETPINGILVFVFCLLTFTAAAQNGTIEGRVIDASSLDPLPFANVFINNTTIGASTDASGNFILKDVPPGNHEVVFSYVGYGTFQARYQVNEDQATRVNIRLTPSRQVLDEVAVKAGRDKTWEKQLKRFEKVFLGEDAFGQKCKINNPWVIDFQVQGPKLTATASAPVDITNEALGYKLTFHLKDFTTDGVTFSIVGNTRFEELQTPAAEDALLWTRNRQTAYRRSARYFFKSLIDQQVEQEGFRLYKDAGPGTPARANSFNSELVRNVVPYLPGAIVNAGVTIHELKVTLKERIEVHYLNEPTRTYFYKDVGHSVSWLETKTGSVRVTREGVVLNPKELVVSGDMSIGRVSEMLPLDYRPGTAVKVKSTARQLLAQRFEEKTYLHLNKPYFYPGETVWFKSYMSWRDRGRRDSLGNVLYVDLINPKMEIVQSRMIRLDSLRYGEFRLPNQMMPGLYFIRAYTNWMINYGENAIFSMPLPVLDPYEKLSGSKPIAAESRGVIDIATDRESYSPREKVTVNLTFSDEDGKAVGGDFSISVIDAQQVRTLPWKKSISSELAFGEFVPPSAPFSRRVEYGFTLKGQFLNDRGKPAAREDLTLIIGNFEGLFTTTTDANGIFSLINLPFYDSIRFAVQAKNRKAAYGTITVIPESKPIASYRPDRFKYEVEKEGSLQRVVPPYELQPDVILLKEVSIRSTRIETEKTVTNLYGVADRVFKHEDLVKRGSSLATVLQPMMPGYALSFVGDHWYFIRERSIGSSGRDFQSGNSAGADKSARPGSAGPAVIGRGQTPAEPMLVVDNVIFMPGVAETVGDKLQAINTSNVERVEINSAVGSLTGANGVAGVINVVMKKGSDIDTKSSYQVIQIKGFDVPAQFKSLDYGQSSEDHSRQDLRSTLYWNPSVVPDASGNVSLSFYASDLQGNYLLTLEGILADGTPVQVQKTIVVK